MARAKKVIKKVVTKKIYYSVNIIKEIELKLKALKATLKDERKDSEKLKAK